MILIWRTVKLGSGGWDSIYIWYISLGAKRNQDLDYISTTTLLEGHDSYPLLIPNQDHHVTCWDKLFSKQFCWAFFLHLFHPIKNFFLIFQALKLPYVVLYIGTCNTKAGLTSTDFIRITLPPIDKELHFHLTNLFLHFFNISSQKDNMFRLFPIYIPK